MSARTIDGHRHLMCLEAHSLATQLDPEKANSTPGVSEASTMVNLQKAPEWVRKMTDFDEHIADMDAAGIDVGVIWPPPPGFRQGRKPRSPTNTGIAASRSIAISSTLPSNCFR